MPKFSSILITGANRGLGLELVKQLAETNKIPVIIGTCRDKSKAQKLNQLASTYPNINILEIDVQNYDQYPNLVQQVSQIVGDSGLDVLFNNAGILNKTPLESITVDELTESFRVNTISPIMMIKEFLPLIKKSSSANKVILNMTSLLGSIADNSSNGCMAYRLSKAALNMASKNLSIHLQPHKIPCISIHPGWVKTEMGGEKAPLNVEESVSHMINTLHSLTEEQNGKMINYDGAILPW